MSAEFLPALLSIIVINLVVSGDNAVVIGMAAHRLPPQQRRLAIHQKNNFVWQKARIQLSQELLQAGGSHQYDLLWLRQAEFVGDQHLRRGHR